jgi:predicted RNase H-like HicB family nuclease
MRYYIALAHSSPDRGFAVTLPDFPGWRAMVRSFDEIRPAAARGLAAVIEGLLARGGAIPEPSSFDALMAAPGNQDCEALLVPAPEPAAAAHAPGRPDDPFHRASNDEWPEASA